LSSICSKEVFTVIYKFVKSPPGTTKQSDLFLLRTEPSIVYFKSYYVELQEQRLQSLRGISINCLTIELNTGRRYPAPHTKVKTQRTVQCNMALLSNQITPNQKKM